VLCYDFRPTRIDSFQESLCTEDDWECDFGFKRDLDNSCTKELKVLGNPRSDPCEGREFYLESQGYSLIKKKLPSFHHCRGGVGHSPKKIFCPPPEKNYELEDFSYVLVLLSLSVFGGVAVYIFLRNFINY